MGKLKNSLGGYTGKLGPTTAYELNGKPVIRTVGKITKKPTTGKLAQWQKTSLTNSFLKSIKDFIKVGYHLEGLQKDQNYFNAAASVNRKGVRGEYPNQYLDYSHLLVAKGNMPPPLRPTVETKEDGITFTWEADLQTPGTRKTDLVMVLAYFPEHNRAIFLRSGERRTVESQHLPLPNFEKPSILHTYISFIAEDHSKISDSLYINQMIWAENR